MGTRELDQRLRTVAAMVPKTQLAVDVGSDHGLVVAHLVETGRVARGIATDINPSPLENTRRLLGRKGLLDRVDLHLTDGLAGVAPEGVGAIVIAGMGGELIAEIIGRWPHSKTPGIAWVLQPMTRASHLRQQLWQNGFGLWQERICHVQHRSYTVMLAGYLGAPRLYLPWQPHLGRLHPRSPQDALWLEHHRDHLVSVAAAREKAQGPSPETAGLKQAARMLHRMVVEYRRTMDNVKDS